MQTLSSVAVIPSCLDKNQAQSLDLQLPWLWEMKYEFGYRRNSIVCPWCKVGIKINCACIIVE
jgi:hypothetical protein